MKKTKWLIALVVIGILAGLWFGRLSIIPRGIARISGDIYMAEHFPEMKLRVAGVDATLVNGNYRIVFWDPSNSTYYDCSIGPKYFPVSISEGLDEIERDYAEKYK